MRRVALSTAGFVTALLAVTGLVAASCPYPLGEFAAEGHIQTREWSPVKDLERSIIEATLIHGQKSFGMIVNAEGQLHFLYDDEVEFELPDGSPAETQSIYYKEYSNTTGWDVPLLDLATNDVNNPKPDARNVQPYATSFHDQFWAVWEVTGDPAYRVNGGYILLRGKTASGFTNITPVYLTPFDSSNKQARIISLDDTMYIAWQTNAYQNDSLEYRLVGRTWNGTAFGPLEMISPGNDGWSDQIPTLATDGTRVFAAWASQNTSQLAGQGDWVVKVAVRDANGTWGQEVPLTVSTDSNADSPSAAWYDGKLYVAWSTNDPTNNPGSDFDTVMRSFDPDNGGRVGEELRISTAEFQLGDFQPALYAWPVSAGGDGALHILWTSDSTPSGIATSGSDNDVYYRTFNGSAFGPIRLISDPLDNGFFETLSGFFTVGDELFAYYLSNICLPGCGHETDWREMTRLLERPVRWYDDVSATYALGTDWPTSNRSVASMHFAHADGTPADSSDYYIQTASGEVIHATTSGGAIEVPFTYNATALDQVTATYCGLALPTTQTSEGPLTTPAKVSPAGDVVLPAVIAAALLGAIGARRRKGG